MTCIVTKTAADGRMFVYVHRIMCVVIIITIEYTVRITKYKIIKRYRGGGGGG